MRITPSIYLVGDTPLGLTKGGDCHVYLINGPKGIFLIDSGNGYDIEGLFNSIEAEGFNPKRISHVLLTHHHTDHARGAKALRDQLGCRVWISGNVGKYMIEQGNDDELWVNDGIACGLYAPDYFYIHCPVDHAVSDAEEFELGGVHITALNITGHSPDSVCYIMEIDGLKCMFDGDVIFWGGILGLLNYPGSSLLDYHASLPRLGGLGIDGFFPGHGLFCIKGGQAVIDSAIKNLKAGVFVPYSVGQMPVGGL